MLSITFKLFSDLLKQVLNVLAYDPSDDIYYGISTNKKTLLRSKFSPLMEWTGINDRIWNKVKASPSLITATEVPFAPVLLADASEPYDALKVPSLGVSYMWGGNYLTIVVNFSCFSSFSIAIELNLYYRPPPYNHHIPTKTTIFRPNRRSIHLLSD